MTSWAFIFEAPEMDPVVDRMVVERAGVRTTIVGVPDPSALTEVVAELVAEGVQFIELCGGFEPVHVGKVIEATGGGVPVGSVGYAGGESISRLAGIIASDG